MFEVLQAGPRTTVQDLGRPGMLSLGIPPSGAMDRYALRCGNRLVGNEPGESALEILLNGLTLRCLGDVVVAVTGADSRPLLNRGEMPMWQAVPVGKGDVMAFPRFPDRGCRTYLCVHGGFPVPPVLGSRSTYLEAGFGGLEGRALRAGDVLQVGETEGAPPRKEDRRMHPRLVPEYPRRVELRVVMGPQNFMFTEESVVRFLAHTWRLSPQTNRVGLRYEKGPEMEFKPRPEEEVKNAGGHISSILPAGNPTGGIQVPMGQEIIVLARDCPTRAGFAKIATVIEADLDKVGQLRPGDESRFRAVEIDEAYSATGAREAILGSSDQDFFV